jgi:flagellin-like hook-associated protein FlgL
MRISDNMRYRLLQANIAKVSQQLDSIQTKIGTGKNINAPSDDPIKFSTSIQYDTELATREQFSNNLQRLSTLVSMYGTCFESIGSQLSSIAQAANSYGDMSDDLRLAASEQIKSTIEQFVTVGNTKLGSTYIFGGKQASSAPFQLNNDYSVTFNVSQSAEDATNIYVDTAQTGQFGVSGREAFFGTSKIAFGSVTNSYAGDIYSNTDTYAYVINSSNNAISVNGTALTPLTSGIYTGASLAKEIQNKLGSQYSVAFDSTTRKFLITNNTSADATLTWSPDTASLLGFNSTSVAAESGQLTKSDFDTGRQSFLVKITHDRSYSEGATYQFSTDGGSTWSVDKDVTTGGADSTADITISSSNNTFYLNGTDSITLDDGTFTGEDLATQIQNKLGAGYSVSYNADTRKFSVTNSTTSAVTFNWSNPDSTAAGVLGFDNIDSVVSSGASDASDYVAGMFIDGAGVVNNTNRGMKLLFSTGATDNLAVNDTFEVKDLNVFELLKNFKDAFESGNSTWISKNVQYIDNARSLTTKNNAVIAFQGTQANTLKENNSTKSTTFKSMQSDLVTADTAELAVQFNTLLNSYQALLSTLARIQSVSILDYL